MRKHEIFAQAAFAELRDALRNAAANKLETGPDFTGSHNCQANIERDHDRRNNGLWFKKDATRFFGTRFPSSFLDVPQARVTLFVTTEVPPNGARRASLRAYLWDTASVATVGPFCDHSLPVVDAARNLVADQLRAA
jgi:hypothetical protein